MLMLAIVAGLALLLIIGVVAVKVADKAHAARVKRQNRSAGAKAGWAKRKASQGRVQ